MRSFADRTGAVWMIDITVLTVERVKAACKIDLPGLLGGEQMDGLDPLLSDQARFLEVVYQCCPQVPGRTIDDLKAVWDGVTADAAIDTFIDDLIGFFPNATRREALTKAIQAQRDLGTAVAREMGMELTPETIEATARGIARLLKNSEPPSSDSSGNTPGSSASTPGL
jgi:hypothetical protein